jgi:hypothetical protein
MTARMPATVVGDVLVISSSGVCRFPGPFELFKVVGIGDLVEADPGGLVSLHEALAQGQPPRARLSPGSPPG